jgi:four helix bundle protein
MKNLTKKEETDKWKETFAARLVKFSVDTLKFSDSLRKNPTRWPVCDQLVRSFTSVGANINEAKGAASKKDFAHYFQIALKSAKETQYWLVVVQHYDTTNAVTAKVLEQEMQEISRIINSSLLTMRGRK